MPFQTRRHFLQATGTAALTGAAIPSLLRAAEPVPLSILFFGGDLPAVKTDIEKEYVLKALSAGVKPKPEKKDADNITGLEQLAAADLWIGSIAKRTFPSDEQLGHFKKHFEAGKPFVGYRAASHVFQNWLVVDKEVFGAKYGGHHLSSKDPVLVIETVKGAEEHPILKGLTPPRPASGSYSYTQLADDVKVLLHSGLPGDMMPHTWVRENARTKSRVFYTRYDAKELATNEVCRQIFLRGIVWALNRDMSKHRKGA